MIADARSASAGYRISIAALIEGILEDFIAAEMGPVANGKDE
jgi:hypothetical protein